MLIVHPISLSATLDSTSEAFFYKKSIPSKQRAQVATLLSSRQIDSGKNSGYFLPFASENCTPARLFSGEPLTTQFARRHFLLIESARLIRLLDVDNEKSIQSLRLAEHRMDSSCYSQFCSTGECKTLSIAYMRYLATHPSKDISEQLDSFFAKLVEHRDGKGKWAGFPFYYTILMLSELDTPLAARELDYAVPQVEQRISQIKLSEPYSQRRQAILNNALSRNESYANSLLLGQHI